MKTLTANQTKTYFGGVLIDVQHSPIEITRNGKPVAVMISEERSTEYLFREKLGFQ